MIEIVRENFKYEHHIFMASRDPRTPFEALLIIYERVSLISERDCPEKSREDLRESIRKHPNWDEDKAKALAEEIDKKQ